MKSEAKMDLQDWIEDIWATLREAPGGEVTTPWHRALEQRCTNERVVTVVIGPFDSGKSSLLKRLLIEAGNPVPEWLTVAGRRETFEINTATCLGLDMVDTPGMFSGEETHDRAAWEAVELADFILWVLPPQLITSGREVAGKLLGGRYFAESCDSSVITESLAFVAARMDEAQVDPEDEPEAYQELCSRKLKELAESVEKLAGTSIEIPSFAVAADPFGIVANNPSPTPADYEASRSWDGIQDLKVFLEGLTQRRDRLRELAQVRYSAISATRFKDVLAGEHEERKQALAACSAEVERARIFGTQATNIAGEARSDLRRRVGEIMLSIMRRGNIDGLADELRSELEKQIDEWQTQYSQKLDALAAECGAEFASRLQSPSLSMLDRICREQQQSEEPQSIRRSSSGAPVKKTLHALSSIKDALKKGAEADLGMPLGQAEKLLKKLREAKTNSSPISTRGLDREKATKYVKIFRLADVALPVIEQLGSLIGDVMDDAADKKESKRRAQKRNELRTRLDNVIEEIKTEAQTECDKSCEEFRQCMQDYSANFEGTAKALNRQVEKLETTLGRLGTLLGSSTPWNSES